jgi:lysophospholipase L1-like esterase
MAPDAPVAPAAGRPRQLSLRVKLAWCVLAPVLAAALLEFLVAALDIAPRRAQPMAVWNARRDGELDADDGHHRFHERWLWELRPGAEIDGEVINDDCMRGPQIPREPRPKLRIAAIGESVTFGMGVHAGEAWPAVLEQLLRDRGLDVQVLNFGVIGYTLAQGRELYLGRASAWEPDVLLVCFPCVNEAANATDGFNDLVKMQIVKRRSFELRMFLDRFASVRWLASVLGKSLAPEALVEGSPNPRAPRVNVADFAGLIGQLQDETRARGCSLVLVSAARSQRGEAAQPAALEYTAALERSAAQLSIPLADAHAAFAAAAATEDELYLDAWHPTPEGHRVYAATVAAALDRAGLSVPEDGR